ncbi:MAG: hypothetical protein ACKE5M_00895 [Methylophilaceae bacterium]
MIKISIPATVSAVLAFGYFTPWLIEANRFWLGVYLASFFWFAFFAWFFFFRYLVPGIKRDLSFGQRNAYISAAIIFISYVVVLSGIAGGYMVTV